ncbi:uncharacterized protein LOC130654488 isoform X1 [Hydractinia symbiolongicarpus]|uniref:uncharacterized protein LOC130654488 isoform X1 n=1 Tax=Hydractinia symbiolongicarpus TaxID=13093 RepID=UPI0025500352|nr:uncharacterized protein LOC130654488 isoform X1 [Hydractinia symbiolongicarpus]
MVSQERKSSKHSTSVEDQNTKNKHKTKLSQPSTKSSTLKQLQSKRKISSTTVITDAYKKDVVFRKKVNQVGIDAFNEKRKSCPSKSQRASLTSLKTAVSDDSLYSSSNKSKNPVFTFNKIQSIDKHNDVMEGNLIDLSPPSKALPPVPSVENSYSYADLEFRPMNVRESGAFSTPINDRTKIVGKPPQGAYSYTRVSLRPMAVGITGAITTPIQDGKPAEGLTCNTSTQHIETGGDLYAVLDKDTQKKDYQSMGYDSVVITKPATNTNVQDLYAAIDYSNKRRPSAEDVLTQSNGFDPDIRIRNGSRRVSDGLINTPYFNHGRKPPPIPRPYDSDRKPSLPPHPEEPSAISAGMRQRLDSFNRNSVSTEDMLGSCAAKNSGMTDSSMYETTDFYQRTLLPEPERLSKSHNAENLNEIRKFKKQHRRMKSHETVGSKFFQELNESRTSNMSPSNSSSSLSTSKESEDDLLSDGAHSIDMNEVIRKANALGTDELPEGWQEVSDGPETYYWHIWTGTIQYERPVVSTTPSSLSRSDSPFSGHGSRSSSVSDVIDDKNLKNPSPRPDTPDKAKQIISFPVHSMGWMDVDEEYMGPKIIGDTVNNCIITLAEKRHDLWNTAETWAEGADIKLILEGQTLKLVEPTSQSVLHVQPIAKMRVWGVGRVESRDFAYIARDQSTGKHRCHMFRCHGNVSGRSITNALQAICNRVLDEKRRAKSRSESPSVRVSDLLKPPPKTTTNFNEKPYMEQKKCFTAKYVGSTEVSKSSGIDVINKVVERFSEKETSADWSSVLVEVTTSEIKTIDCVKQQTSMEHRVRFISFLGVAHDERFGAYIVAVSKESFVCHVFFCAPHAGTLTKAIEEACKLRFEKMLDGKLHRGSQQAETPIQKPVAPSIQQPSNISSSPRGSVKEKTKFLTSSIAGVFNKLNKKDNKKKDDESLQGSGPVSLIPGPNEHLVKYFGSVAVDIGTGVETVQNAVKELAGGDMMIGYLEIQSDCITLSDSQRTALSKRIFDLNTISYCGMTSDRKHFGMIVSRGKGKYTCHVFQEYKPNLGNIVNAIHEVL